MGSYPDSTFFIMGVWPIKNPCKPIWAIGAVWDLFAWFGLGWVFQLNLRII
jgi:hypothetical protein